MVTRTDMAALMPRRLADLAALGGRVELLDTPYATSPREIGLVHRRDRLADPAHAWFIDLLLDTARALQS
jgi:DNA-binding transcriptional LysR family regulator